MEVYRERELEEELDQQTSEVHSRHHRQAVGMMYEEEEENRLSPIFL